jgi:tRNA modification GTPase
MRRLLRSAAALGSRSLHCTSPSLSPMSYFPHTAFALSTPPGKSAIAVIRLTGSRSLDALMQLSAGTADVCVAGDDELAVTAMQRHDRVGGVRPPTPRVLHMRRLFCPKRRVELDKAMVVYLPAPSTYTGEDVVELHVHGGRAVVNGIVQALGAMKVRGSSMPLTTTCALLP